MELDPAALDVAVARGIITRAQADALLREPMPAAAQRHPLASAAGLGAVVAASTLGQLAAPALFGPHPAWPQRALISVAIGVAALVVAFVLDGHVARELPAWIYGGGLVALRGGLAFLGGDGPGAIAGRLAADVALVGAGVLLRRPIFVVTALLGLVASAGARAESLGGGGLLPPLLLAAGALAAWWAYDRHRAALEGRLARALPELVQRLMRPRWGG